MSVVHRPEWPAGGRSRVVLASVAVGVLLLLSVGCGMRSPKTGAVQGRVLDSTGAIVQGATVYSLFVTEDKALSARDGMFYLSEIPEGHNQLVVTHPNYEIHHEECDVVSGKMTELERVVLDKPNQSQLISGYRIESTTSSSVSLAWITAMPAVCQVEIGTGTRYGRIVDEIGSPTVNHQLTIGGLLSETVYHARIRLPHEDGGFRVSYDLAAKTSDGDRPRPSPALRIGVITVYGSVPLSWDPSPTTVGGYRLYRRERGQDNWVLLTTDTLAANDRTFTDSTTQGGRWYDYQVEAVFGNGAPSINNPTASVFMAGHILSDTHFTVADSPLDLTADLVVEPGVTLTIDAGVVVRVAASDSLRMGDDPDRVEITVRGRLALEGTSAAPVRFSPLNGAGDRAHWGGIHLRSYAWVSDLTYVELFGTAGSAVSVETLPVTLSHVSIKHAVAGIDIVRLGSTQLIDGCTFTDVSSTAMRIRECKKIDIRNCTMTEVGVGLDVRRNTVYDELRLSDCDILARDFGIVGTVGRATIKNVLVVAPRGTGMQFAAMDGIPNTIDHCTIDADVGVEIGSGLPTLENNIITSVTGTGTAGIRAGASLNVPSFDVNDVFNFANNYENCSAGVAALSVDPRFVGGLTAFDYHLAPLSPAARGDRNGTEMGRYGRSYY